MKTFDFKNDVVLENARVQLRPLRMSDHEVLLPIAIEHRDLLQFSPSQINSPKKLTYYLEQALNAKKAGVRYPFIIFDKQQQQYAGSTSFGHISNYDQRLEIGWTWIGKGFQGSGLNKECKFLLLRYAFEQLEFQRVEFKTDSRNLQSRKAIEKIGGKYEGELRSHTLMSDGYRRNTVYYSILSNEWEGLKSSIFHAQAEYK
ncbi:GNAT family protein [Rapidithrix thailandica]|uniref:GNAT family protein n=1 Tax=Rapidithrix thailandica TaxID=413964 RepID=A0AAW9SFB5_9BACT